VESDVQLPGATYTFPLSFAQQRLWFHYVLEPDNPAYNIPYLFRLTDRLVPEVLQQAVDLLVERHESLRTSFAVRDGEPVQIVHARRPVRVERIDLSSAEDAENKAAELLAQLARRPYRLEDGLLLRVTVVDLPGGGQLLGLGMHHIISDFTSCGIFMAELAGAYDAITEGREPRLPELPVQYPDYTVWQQEWLGSGAAENRIRASLEDLAGCETLLALPAQRPRPQVRWYRGRVHEWRLDVGTSAALRAIARANQATLFMTTLAVFNVMLARSTGTTDVMVGAIPSGRSFVDLERTIGFFVNAVPVRTRFEPAATFREVLDCTRTASLAALARGDIPFDILTRRLGLAGSLSHNPLVQVAFVLHHVRGLEVTIGGRRVLATEIDNRTAKFDLTMCVFDHVDELQCLLEYDSDLFSETTIRAMADSFSALCAELAAQGADVPYRALAMAGPEAHEPPLRPVVDGDGEARTGVWSRAAEDPSRPAVGDCSYGEVVARADALARVLRAAGVARTTPVAVAADSGADLLVSVLGTLAAGGVVTLLREDARDDDIRALLDDLAQPLVVSSPGRLAALRALGALCVELPRAAETGSGAPPPTPGPGDPVFLEAVDGGFLTVGHEALAAAVHRMEQDLDLRAEDRLLVAGGTGCLDTVVTMLAALNAGGVVLSDPAGEPRPEFIGSGATVFRCPPWWPDPLPGHDAGPLRVVSVDGVAPARLRDATAARTGVTLVEHYRPEGLTLPVARLDRLDPGAGGLPIRLLDDDMRTPPRGVPGRIHVVDPPADGYLDEPARTAERFRPDPRGSSGRVFRTGDFGRIGDEGLEILGSDHVNAPGGARTFPADVRRVLVSHPAVRDATVSVERGPDGAATGFAAVVDAGSPPLVQADELRKFVADVAPRRMRPVRLVVGEAANEPDAAEAPAGSAAKPAGDDLEARIHRVWARLLDRRDFGVTDDFFVIGGHSLLATRLAFELSDELGVNLPVRAAFSSSTIAKMADLVRDKGRTE
jgi:non-ribosomal peptide synthetase component F